MSFCVKVPKRHQGIPGGAVSEMAGGREPTSLEAIERAAVEAVRADPWRAFEWVEFLASPLPSNTVAQRVAGNPTRGPLDDAEVMSVPKTVYDIPSWRACRPERVKHGVTIPAEPPTIFDTAEDVEATLERYHRLGAEAGVPLANHLGYGIVCPLSEWAETAGKPSAAGEQEQLQAEVELERLKAQERRVAERIAELRDQLVPTRITASSDWIGVRGEKGIQSRSRADGTTVWRHRGGQTVDTLEEAIRDRDRQPFDREALDAVIAEADA